LRFEVKIHADEKPAALAVKV